MTLQKLIIFFKPVDSHDFMEILILLLLDEFQIRSWDDWLDHDVQSVEKVILGVGPNFFIEPIYTLERGLDQS